MKSREPSGRQTHQKHMRRFRNSIAALALGAIVLSACGSEEPIGQPDGTPGEALFQITSEGGFVPVEWNLGRGPTFTVTNDGKVVFPGVTTLEYPGKLVPNYQAGQLSSEQFSRIRQLLAEMDLGSITEERDDSVTNVADASTEVIEFWDDTGVHRYSVYALGITEEPRSERTEAFSELFDYLHQVTAVIDAEPYEASQIRVVAGADYNGADPQFIDIRPWPLEGENPDEWPEYATVGEDQVWTCKVFDDSVASTFADATQATRWMHPSQGGDAQNFNLLVRPLHPGESGCEL